MANNTSKTVEHTPGPWEARSRSMSDGALVVMDAEYNEICAIREHAERKYGPQNDVDMANARLIAAAPDLLAALEHIASLRKRADDAAGMVDDPYPRALNAAVTAACEALARAKGE